MVGERPRRAVGVSLAPPGARVSGGGPLAPVPKQTRVRPESAGGRPVRRGELRET